MAIERDATSGLTVVSGPVPGRRSRRGSSTIVQTVLSATFLLTLGTAVIVVSIGFAQGDFETQPRR